MPLQRHALPQSEPRAHRHLLGALLSQSSLYRSDEWVQKILTSEANDAKKVTVPHQRVRQWTCTTMCTLTQSPPR